MGQRQKLNHLLWTTLMVLKIAEIVLDHPYTDIKNSTTAAD